MSRYEMPWSLILAAGDGRRLSGLTTRGNISVPKQFCTLGRGPSLLQDALNRAQAVSARERICTVVAAAHQHWWKPQLESLPFGNIIVQPSNRGTANGILLPLLHILERDPDARLLLLPSDHYVGDEPRLAQSLFQMGVCPAAPGSDVVLLGFRPRAPDPELGYIVPGGMDGSPYREVARFVEKPQAPLARELVEGGALWNAFIIAADGQALLKLLERRCPEVVAAMQAIMACTSIGAERARALCDLYQDLANLDFSRHVLQGQEQHLHVLAVPECGWSDLGTPQRVAEVLASSPWRAAVSLDDDERTLLSLAAQHRRLNPGRAQPQASAI